MRWIFNIALDLADVLFFEEGVFSFLLRVLASALVLVVTPLSLVAMDAANMPFKWPATVLCLLVIPLGIPAFVAKGRPLNAWTLGVVLALVGAVLLEPQTTNDAAPIPLLGEGDSIRFVVNCAVLLAIVGTACRWLWIGACNVVGLALSHLDAERSRRSKSL